MAARKTIFVAHSFRSSGVTELRAAIDRGLAGSGFSVVYGDAGLGEGQIFDSKILGQIESAEACFCEVSHHDRPSVFFELGAARALRKPIVLLTRDNGDLRLPADLEGFERIVYDDYADLRRQLRMRLQDIQKLIGHGSPAQRVALLCSTTDDIEASGHTPALRRFYGHLFEELNRSTLGINNCGAEPFREAAIDAYHRYLKKYNRDQMRCIDQMVSWFWHPTGHHGFSEEPPCYRSFESPNREQRTLDEALASSAIVAFTGRSGIRGQIERLLQYHRSREQGIDLDRRPLILLAWFGGSVADLIAKKGAELDWLLQRYPFLDPWTVVPDWHHEDKSRDLAKRLVSGIQRVLEEVPRDRAIAADQFRRPKRPGC